MPRILIVDDEPVVLDVLRRLLEEDGREIALAGSSDAALAVAAQVPLDVALVDKNLGTSSGLELSRKLKSLQPELEVILITGYASLDTAIEAVQIGAFDQEDAANEVADHISRRYHTAKVLRFSSPVGDWWVRVRVKDDDRERAEEIARDTRTPQGSIFLVRLD